LYAQFGPVGGDRVYYVERSTDWAWWELGYFELQGNTVSNSRAIMDSASPPYQGRRVLGQRVSAIFRGAPSSDDFVSFGWSEASGAFGIDVVQVGPGCVVGLDPEPCLDQGSAARVAYDIDSDPVAFAEEWTPPGSLWPGYLMRQMLNADGTRRIETVDPLTETVLVNHGVGVQPATLKH
jgi:hypothetical protein